MYQIDTQRQYVYFAFVLCEIPQGIAAIYSFLAEDNARMLAIALRVWRLRGQAMPRPHRQRAQAIDSRFQVCQVA